METPPPQPKSPEIDLKREVARLQQESRAVSQYLWLTIASLREETMDVILDTSRIDPLWSLVFLHVLDEKGEIDPGRIRVAAATIPPMTEQEKKRLVRRLKGTSERNLAAVLKELGLDHFPTPYVERFISDRVKWNPSSSVWEGENSSLTTPDTPSTPETST